MKTIRNLSLMLLLQLACNTTTAQTLVWAKHAGGSQNFSSDIVVNASGNLYSTGIVGNGTGPGFVDFDPGPGMMNVPFNTGGSTYVTKRDTTGNLIWAKSFSGTGYTWARSMALDGQENVFVMGEFYNTTDFDPGTGVYNLSSSQNNSNCFLCKLSSNGDFIWAIKLPYTMGYASNNFAVDLSGNAYIGGNFSGNCDFDPGQGTYILNSQNSISFILKLDPLGNFSFVKTMEMYYLSFLTLDPLGNIYITGEYGGTIDFDPGSGITNLTSQGVDAFIAKYDNGGSLLWAKSVGGSGIDLGNSMFVDALGNSYTRGTFSLTADFDPGPGTYTMAAQQGKKDQFFLKLNAAGNFIWAKQLAVDNGTSSNITRGISADAAGNLLIIGYYNGTVDFDPGPGNYYMTYTSQPNASPTYLDETKFVLQLNSSGGFVWAYTMGTKVCCSGSVVHDSSGAIYLAGTFNGAIDFDPGPAVYNLNAGTTNMLFFLKLASGFLPTTLVQQHAEQAFGIYPNPTNDLIKLSTKEQGQRSYKITDTNGKEILKGKLISGENTISLEQLPPGLYFIFVGEGTQPAKIIKQ